MIHPSILQVTAPAGSVITVVQTLAFGVITVAASVLVYYLAVYVRDILVEPYRDRWRYLVVGVAAAVVYGLAGLTGVFTDLEAASTFRIGATLFFFLFSAVGVRALYGSVRVDRDGVESVDVPGWAWYVVLGVVIVAWWGAYLVATPDVVALVETVGLAGAVSYTLVYAVLTVRDAEGTSIAAVVRQFVPALLSFAAVVIAEQAGQYTPVDPAVVVGVELVGTVLVGAFLFTTAVAIRQQGGELSRLYDQTTWRQQKLE
ncbi:hypothetical protein [Halorarius halobius]|uniref:hypothetical protein n=1 Tax=Halorarius halobius TaxID=2962671 RepID=UPI0020CB6B91|nr:hypothetical protein [Halorarius halobius]